MSNETGAPKKWIDVVFEGRNKEYGAYIIRTIYSRNVILSLVITLLSVTFVFAYPTLAKLFSSDDDMVAKAPVLTTISLEQPPPITNTPPPPKMDIPPPVKTIIKFLPPKVTDKPVEEEEEMPTQEEIKEVEVGPETVEGTGEVVFTEPVKDEGPAEDPNQIFLVVEQPPEYQGGMEALYKYLGKSIRYPAQARRMGIEGSVFVTFVVETDGKITDVKTIKGIGGGCDEEAVRVVQMMPPWKAGKQRGRPVKVRFTLPIKFRLG